MHIVTRVIVSLALIAAAIHSHDPDRYMGAIVCIAIAFACLLAELATAIASIAKSADRPTISGRLSDYAEQLLEEIKPQFTRMIMDATGAETPGEAAQKTVQAIKTAIAARRGV